MKVGRYVVSEDGLRRRPRRQKPDREPPLWCRTWLCEQSEDHPQRLLAQPNWRHRLWLKRKTVRSNELAMLLVNAPAVLVNSFFHGLIRMPSL